MMRLLASVCEWYALLCMVVFGLRNEWISQKVGHTKKTSSYELAGG
jgi:hypothetical protein